MSVVDESKLLQSMLCALYSNQSDAMPEDVYERSMLWHIVDCVPGNSARRSSLVMAPAVVCDRMQPIPPSRGVSPRTTLP